jgi:serine protease AprX
MIEEALKDGRELPVIVRYKTDAAGERVKRQKGGKREFRRQLRSMRALGMRVNHRALRELLEDESDDIESVSYDAPVKGHQLGLLPTDPPATGVDASASGVARSRYGVNGSGVTVAVIDSGVRPQTDLPTSRIKAFVDFVNGRTTAYDDYGHGTHVAGIIAGSGSSTRASHQARRSSRSRCSTTTARARRAMCSPRSTGCSRITSPTRFAS